MAESNNKKDNKSEAKNEKKASFITRFISSCFLILIGGGCVILGKIPLALLLVFISFIGLFELYRVFQIEKSVLIVPAYIAALSYAVFLYFELYQFLVPLFLILFLILLALYVFLYPKFEIDQIIKAIFSFLYIVVCLGYVYMIRGLDNGVFFAILILVCTCGNDIFAYLVGVSIGKHKMFPVLSPKKSVEGFIGGIVGAGVLGAIFGLVFKNLANLEVIGYEDLNYCLVFAIIAAIGALPAVVGDLVASGIKRNYGIKDYGKLIPGHGGILDRFDSMIFTAPIIYYLVVSILKMY